MQSYFYNIKLVHPSLISFYRPPSHGDHQKEGNRREKRREYLLAYCRVLYVHTTYFNCVHSSFDGHSRFISSLFVLVRVSQSRPWSK